MIFFLCSFNIFVSVALFFQVLRIKYRTLSYAHTWKNMSIICEASCLFYNPKMSFQGHRIHGLKHNHQRNYTSHIWAAHPVLWDDGSRLHWYPNCKATICWEDTRRRWKSLQTDGSISRSPHYLRILCPVSTELNSDRVLASLTNCSGLFMPA